VEQGNERYAQFTALAFASIWYCRSKLANLVVSYHFQLHKTIVLHADEKLARYYEFVLWYSGS